VWYRGQRGKSVKRKGHARSGGCRSHRWREVLLPFAY
jgi:hypothetical protein